MVKIKNREKLILESAHVDKAPFIACTGSGYLKDINVIVEANANNYHLAREIWN